MNSSFVYGESLIASRGVILIVSANPFKTDTLATGDSRGTGEFDGESVYVILTHSFLRSLEDRRNAASSTIIELNSSCCSCRNKGSVNSKFSSSTITQPPIQSKTTRVLLKTDPSFRASCTIRSFLEEKESDLSFCLCFVARGENFSRRCPVEQLLDAAICEVR